MKFFPNFPVKSQIELLLTVKRDAEMLIRLLCNAPAAQGTGEKSLLQKVGFVDILERNGLLIDRGGLLRAGCPHRRMDAAVGG